MSLCQYIFIHMAYAHWPVSTWWTSKSLTLIFIRVITTIIIPIAAPRLADTLLILASKLVVWTWFVTIGFVRAITAVRVTITFPFTVNKDFDNKCAMLKGRKQIYCNKNKNISTLISTERTPEPNGNTSMLNHTIISPLYLWSIQFMSQKHYQLSSKFWNFPHLLNANAGIELSNYHSLQDIPI